MPSRPKAPDALRTIGEVARETGIAPHVLRYWEAHVSALKPVRRAGGRRYFRTEDVAVIRQLHALVSERGYTLDGAARSLRSNEPPPPATAAHQPGSTGLGNDAMLSEKLLRIRNRLQATLDSSMG